MDMQNYMMTIKKYFFSFVMLGTLLFCSCSPEIIVQAIGKDDAKLSFQTSFSAATEKTLKSMIGSVSGMKDENVPLVSTNDITLIMQSAGFEDITATAATQDKVGCEGKVHAVSEHSLSDSGVLSRTEKSLTLTFGPAQFQALYGMVTEEAQAYFDLLMIPALNDDEQSVAEYNELLASVYGQSFADEITNGNVSLRLRSPDGKKHTDVRISLGELLTLTKSKSWTVTW